MTPSTSNQTSSNGWLGGYHFKPPLFLTLTTLLLLALFMSLGFWQLSRAEKKSQLLALQKTRLKEKPIPIQALPKDKKKWQYLPIIVQGSYDNDRQFLLDNKIYKHQVGYHLITPLKIKGLEKIVLIDRGWIPAGNSRQALPKLKPLSGLQTIQGVIRRPLGKAFTLAKQSPTVTSWPRRIQTIDFDTMAKALNNSVYPFIILADNVGSHKFLREWPTVNMRPEKHLGYAIQWFAFAAVLLIIFIGVNIKRDDIDKEKSSRSPPITK